MKRKSIQKSIVTIVIAIIIVITLVVGNDIRLRVSSRNYNSANGSSSNQKLLPEYVKAGITIGGITGTLENLDTSDATATPEDITEGKTAYVNGEKITGTWSASVEELNPDKVYYADIEGDGIVDGVIYADLSTGGSGQWRKYKWNI